MFHYYRKSNMLLLIYHTTRNLNIMKPPSYFTDSSISPHIIFSSVYSKRFVILCIWLYYVILILYMCTYIFCKYGGYEIYRNVKRRCYRL